VKTKEAFNAIYPFPAVGGGGSGPLLEAQVWEMTAKIQTWGSQVRRAGLQDYLLKQASKGCPVRNSNRSLVFLFPHSDRTKENIFLFLGHH